MPQARSLNTTVAGVLAAALVALLGMAAVSRADDSTSQPLGLTIDASVAAHAKERGIVLAGPAADAEFLRRLFLDLTGTIPPASETRAFIADAAPDKRQKLIDRLLASSEHARHMARVFGVMLMERRTDKHVPSAQWQ